MITILVDAYPIGKDLHFINDYIGKIIYSPTSAPLFKYNNQTKVFEKYFCKDYFIENNGKIHKCSIKDNLYFSDGTKLNIIHYYNAFQKILSTLNPISILLSNIVDFNEIISKGGLSGVDSIRLEEDFLVFSLVNPDYMFFKTLSRLNFSPLSDSLNNDSSSAGPYFIEHISEKAYYLKKNAFFHTPERREDEIIFLYSDDRYEDINLFNQGDVDITCNTMFPYEEIDIYRKKSMFRAEPNDIIMSLELNKVHFDNPDYLTLSKAIASLINREDISKSLFNALTPCNSFVLNRDTPLRLKADELYNPSMGQQKLAEYLQNSNQESISITVAYDNFYPNGEVATKISRQLKKFNIDIINIEDNYYAPGSSSYDYKLTLSSPHIIDDISYYQTIAYTTPLFNDKKSLKNYLSYISLYKTIKEEDVQKKSKIIDMLNRYVLDSGLTVPLFHMHSYYLIGNDLKDFNFGFDTDFTFIKKED